MPDDGWSEPWPRAEHDDLGVWDQFVAQIEPGDLEHERMRVLGDLNDERFGSNRHRKMVKAHEAHVEQLQEDRAELADMIRRTHLSPERAWQRIVAERRENRNHHTRGTAA